MTMLIKMFNEKKFTKYEHLKNAYEKQRHEFGTFSGMIDRKFENQFRRVDTIKVENNFDILHTNNTLPSGATPKNNKSTLKSVSSKDNSKMIYKIDH